MFWYLGLMPDLASLRDRATTRWKKMAFSIASAGWRGAASHWQHYEKAYLLLAGLATGWCFRCIAWCPSISPRPWCPDGT